MSTPTNCERTLVIIKPDAVERGLVGTIITRFEHRGFKIKAAKFIQATDKELEQHYYEHKDKPFYPGLAKAMKSGPMLLMVLEGFSVVSNVRMMMGETNPNKSAPGTIRGDFAVHYEQNLVHGSDSIMSAKREIDLWFPDLDSTALSHDCL